MLIKNINTIIFKFKSNYFHNNIIDIFIYILKSNNIKFNLDFAEYVYHLSYSMICGIVFNIFFTTKV
jgi:hypothetical protein